MSEPVDTSAVEATDLVDPKDAMRLALERKQQAQKAHDNPEHGSPGQVAGRPQHQAAGRRVFRRKAGS